MKNTLFLACFLLLGQASQAQFASMRGFWYNPSTAEMFGIETDDAGMIKGTGVYYAKGSQKMKFMQIMQQKPLGDGNQYFVKVYAPNNPNMAYELTSNMTPGGIIITLTRTGSRNKPEYFYCLYNDETICKEEFFKTSDPKSKLEDFLSTLKLKNENETFGFSFLETSPTTKDSEVRYKDKAIPATLNANTLQITFKLAPHGMVVADLEYGLGWSVILRDKAKKQIARFEQVFE